MWVDLCDFQRFSDNRIEVLLLELSCGEVDRDGMYEQAFALPFFNLLTNCTHHPFADRHDQSRFLKNGNKLERGHKPMRRMLPAQQSLETGDLAAHQTCLGLIMQHEFVPRECAPKLRFNFQARYCALVHLWKVELVNGRALLFCLEHRSVSIPKQAIRVCSISGIDTDPEACRNIDFLGFQLKWYQEGGDYLFCNHGCILRLGQIGKNEGEFVPAQARNRIA